MKFTKLFEEFVFTEPNQVKLTVTSDLRFLGQDRQDDINAMYSHSNSTVRLAASLLNAMYTQKKMTFLFSRKIMQELLAGDSRAKRSTMSGEDQKQFMAYLLKNKIVHVLKESSKFAGPGAKSSVVEVIHPEIVLEIENLVGKEYLVEQRDATVKFYDDFEKMKNNTSTKSSTDSVNESDFANDRGSFCLPPAEAAEGYPAKGTVKDGLAKEERDKIRRAVSIDILEKNDNSSLLVKLEQILVLSNMNDKNRAMFESFKNKLIEGHSLSLGFSGQLAIVNSRYSKLLKDYPKKMVEEVLRDLNKLY